MPYPEFRFDATVREFRGDGRVSSVLLHDGTELPADAVVVGVGLHPISGSPKGRV